MRLNWPAITRSKAHFYQRLILCRSRLSFSEYFSGYRHDLFDSCEIFCVFGLHAQCEHILCGIYFTRSESKFDGAMRVLIDLKRKVSSQRFQISESLPELALSMPSCCTYKNSPSRSQVCFFKICPTRVKCNPTARPISR